MRVSNKLVYLLTEWEGKESHVYKDIAGFDTIGVGHLLTKSERTSGKIEINNHLIVYRNGLTDKQIGMLLRQDLGGFEKAVDVLVCVQLNQDQFDALVSFCFNVGVRAFKRSTLRKIVDGGLFDYVPTQFRRWVWSGGRKSRGLKNRREKEIRLWEGDYKDVC